MDCPTRLRHPSRAADLRALCALSRAALHPARPLMANLIVTRRCNLACGYCFEYARDAALVPAAALRERIDHLARLRTALVTLTGGEPLLHPELEGLVAHVRARGMVPVMNTNGYLLTADRIDALAAAGLFALQISIDNLEPSRASRKSLRPLWPRLRLLAERARFRVRVNTVLQPRAAGAGAPSEAVAVARAALALGFDAKCSLVRDAAGAAVPLDPATRAAYAEICALGRRSSPLLSEAFQRALLADGAVDWRCRAGARYFHVCEEGLVHYCSSNWGRPGVPLADYGPADLARAFATAKPCAATCTQAYAHQASWIDEWRGQPIAAEPVVAAEPLRRAA
jgi:pyruvate-formate lyase-activating enzyme